MLDAFRRNSRSAIIYVLFGILISAFVISFGPGSRTGATGCSGVAGSYAARVDGSVVSEQDFHYAYVVTNTAAISPKYAKALRRKEFLMDKLIERELLAREAERLGMSVSDKEAEDMIASGRMFVLGVERNVDNYVFNEDKTFNYDHFKAVCQNSLGVTVKKFIEEQQRELMAERVRQLLAAGVAVTPDEVKASYDQRERQINVEFVRFQEHRLADSIALTPGDVAAYRKAHPAELKKYYDEHDFLYKNLEREARLRHLLVTLPKDATPQQQGAAQAKADQAARRVRAGERFADVARALSEDERSRARGGELGWRKKGSTGFGGPVDDKVFAAKKGEVIGPEKTDRGYEVVAVEDFREGTIPLDQVADDIAEEQLRAERGKAKAKAEAEAAYARVKAGEKLDVLFPKPSDADESDPLKKASAQPSVKETGLFARKGDILPELGASAELVKRAFSMQAGEVAGPIEVSDSYAVIRVKERKEPDAAFFAQHKDDLQRHEAKQKWEALMQTFTHQRCLEVRDTIKVNEDVLAYDGVAASKSGEPRYEPCASPESRIPDLSRLQNLSL